MAVTTTKHPGKGREQSFRLGLREGLDFSKPSWMLGEENLGAAMNFFYNINTGDLESRPGLVKEAPLNASAIGDTLTNPITANVGGVHTRFVASSSNLYEVNDQGGGVVSLDLIGALNGSLKPTFANFVETAGGSALYIANGGQLQVYDGNSLSSVTGAPDCSIVVVKSGRLFVNDLNQPDVIRGSGILTETDWTTPQGVFFQVGWPDGDTVIGMEVLGDDLVVFKGATHKKVMILKGAYPDWKINEIARGTSIISPHALSRIGSDLLLFDKDGINSLSGVVEYGDFRLDPRGEPVTGPVVSAQDDTGFTQSWPEQNILMLFPNGSESTAWILHYYLAGDGVGFRWTQFVFGVENIAGSTYDRVTEKMYFVADGSLYSLDVNAFPTVNVYEDDGVAYTQEIRSKVFYPGDSQLLLKRFLVDLVGLATPTTGNIVVYTDQGRASVLDAAFVLEQVTIDAWETTIDVLSQPIGQLWDSSETVRSPQRYRSSSFQFGLQVTAGALALNQMQLTMAFVGR